MSRLTRSAILSSLVLILFSAVPAGIQAQTPQVPARPILEAQQGRYFRWAVPIGWQSSETTNGVTLTSPDGITSVMFAILMRSHGLITPKDFLVMLLQRLPGYGDIQVGAIRNLPNQPSGIPGTVWKVIEAEVSYTVEGKAVAGAWTSATNEYYGIYDAMLMGYHAPKAEWPQVRLFLSEMAGGITITNTRGVAGNDKLIPVKNHPLDNSGLIETWRQKGLSEDRIRKATGEGIRGYERVKDPKSGQIYEMPLEAYDGTMGGYPNPARPTEILQQTQPGE